MPIKDIDQIIHGGLPLRRVKTLAKPKPTSQPNPQHILMKDVVPPLSRGWKTPLNTVSRKSILSCSMITLLQRRPSAQYVVPVPPKRKHNEQGTHLQQRIGKAEDSLERC